MLLKLTTGQTNLLLQILRDEMERVRADMHAPDALTDRPRALRLIERATELQGLVNVTKDAAATHATLGDITHAG